MLSLFWFLVSYEEAIKELATLNRDGLLDQATINFTFKRICQMFAIQDDMQVTMDVLFRTLSLVT